jgi:hypothetical protein
MGKDKTNNAFRRIILFDFHRACLGPGRRSKLACNRNRSLWWCGSICEGDRNASGNRFGANGIRGRGRKLPYPATRPADYIFTVEAHGFRHYSQKGITLLADQTVTKNVTF